MHRSAVAAADDESVVAGDRMDYSCEIEVACDD